LKVAGAGWYDHYALAAAARDGGPTAADACCWLLLASESAGLRLRMITHLARQSRWRPIAQVSVCLRYWSARRDHLYLPRVFCARFTWRGPAPGGAGPLLA